MDKTHRSNSLQKNFGEALLLVLFLAENTEVENTLDENEVDEIPMLTDSEMEDLMDVLEESYAKNKNVGWWGRKSPSYTTNRRFTKNTRIHRQPIGVRC